MDNISALNKSYRLLLPGSELARRQTCERDRNRPGSGDAEFG
jgi:hypothetical protein